MKTLKYGVGDLVRLEKLVGHYGSGKGCVRGRSVALCVGRIGKVIGVNTYSNAGYYYTVEFDVPYKKPNRYGQTSRTLAFRLMDVELDPLFIG